MFSTVLVANRGEIACRIITTLQRMGITAAAVYSDADAGAKHVTMADIAVRVGPAAASQSYMNIDAVLEAASATGAEAIHPGYGFLSENVQFARACAAAQISFIGPTEHALQVMGDKVRSKNHVSAAAVPTVEGISEPGLSDDQLVAAVSQMTFPLLIKPSAGGGGKGMQIVETVEDLTPALAAARRVAKASFGDDTLFIEQLIRAPRHIEVQILADEHGGIIHLGERECSLQRRYQKVIEEAPSSLLSEQTRQRIGQAACDTARSVNYRGAGTVEFLVSAEEPEKFYFMEMNTRLQVEHPVTEQITGIDLVEQQLRIAAGQPLGIEQSAVQLRGHSVEARIYAEDPQNQFLPSAGQIISLSEPSGPGIRVDSAMREGLTVGTDYDPMLAKIIATGTDRHQAFARLQQALGQTAVHGVTTNTAFLQLLAADPDVRAGRMDTTMIERKLPNLDFPLPQQHHAAAAALFLAHRKGLTVPGAAGMDGKHQQPTAWQYDGWRSGTTHPAAFTVVVPGSAQEPQQLRIEVDGTASLIPDTPPGRYLLKTPQASRAVRLSAGAATRRGTDVWVTAEGFTTVLTVLDHQASTYRQLAEIEAELVEAQPEIIAPMPGTVVAVEVLSGSWVEAGDLLVTLEAMKMEHRISAQTAGAVHISVTVGDQVSLGQTLATVETPTATDSKDQP